ncbi:serine-rich adhesin for platelets, partial [Aplysia californica]|uniref:Serine-rich adhesin for platelets n=1 Tax=Aplysia californica TaxID=6500 RepID=A0ABM1W2X0_APLCA
MFLRHSNAKLQEELRATMRSYVEEKSVLRAHLANLRLDLNELHCDNRTVTTEASGEGGGGGGGGGGGEEEDDAASKYSMGSEAELRALMDEPASGEKHGDNNNTLHLPAIKHRGRGGKGGGGGGNSGESSNRSNKTLRFCGPVSTPQTTSVRLPADTADGPETLISRHKSFFDSSMDSLDKQEHQKFSELQRHREALRNQGRAALRDRKASLIRLPTITSAKRRTSLWDSGQYVSRPKGKSTEFESFPYMEASLELSRTNLKIPKIKDPHRTETQRRDVRQGAEANRKRVQFTRPRLEPITSDREKSDRRSVLSGDNAAAAAAAAAAVAGLLGDGDGADSLNTTLADTTLDTTFGGNVSFDEEYFRNLAAQTKARANNNNNNNNNKQSNTADKTANTSTSTTLNTTTTTTTTTNDNNNNNTTHPTTSKNTSLSTTTTTMMTPPDAAEASITESNNNNSSRRDPPADADAEADPTSGPPPDPHHHAPAGVPPLKLRPLAKRNVRLHDLQLRQSRLARVSPPLTGRVSPLTGRVQKTTSDRRSPGEKSLKSSDRSVATKISRLSQETSEWKSQYDQLPDQGAKNKTL